MGISPPARSGAAGTSWRILITAACLVLALLSIARPLDGRSLEFVEAGLQRSLLSFAVARGLNAVISVAQGTEIALQPAGVGLTLTPGQVLDPVNDLVERFSWLMLASSATFGVQDVILHLGAWWPFAALSTALLVLGGLCCWPLPVPGAEFRQWLFKAAILVAFLRFTLPLAAYSSDWVYHEFLQQRYAEATAGLQSASQELEAINREAERPQTSDGSWVDRTRDWFESTTAGMDLEARMARYAAAVEDSVRQAVDLIVVFVVQTLVVPLLVLAGAWLGAKNLLRRRYRFIVEPRG